MARLFTGGALAASIVAYGFAGLVGLVPFVPYVAALATLLLALRALRWHQHPTRPFRGARKGHQASRLMAAHGRAGEVYFGAILGSGLVTEMSTPLVQTGLALCVFLGLPWALLYAVGFAIGRSLPVWVAALRRGPARSPAEIIQRYAGPAAKVAHRPLGSVVSVAVAALVVTIVIRSVAT